MPILEAMIKYNSEERYDYDEIITASNKALAES